MTTRRPTPIGAIACLAGLLVIFLGESLAADPARAVGAVGAGGSADTPPVWLESSLRRVFPDSAPGGKELSLLAARNSRVSFQVALRTGDAVKTKTACAVSGADDLEPRVRFVALVPVPHHTPNTMLSDLDGIGDIPGLVPDPLMPWTDVEIGPRQSRSYWISLKIPPDTKPGPRELTVRMTLGNDTTGGATVIELPVKLEISPLVVRPRENFPVTHWWQGQSTWDYYKTGMFEDPRWWEITRAQLENMLDHGSDVVYVPMFFMRRETFGRPCQLLIANEPSPGKYEFDFSRIKQFTDMCRDIGFRQFEWPHMWIYWGVKNPMPIYTEKSRGKYELLWPKDISGFSDTYLNFLGQFLPQFKAFLDREGLLERSFFHLSDEPGSEHIADYRRARQILRELAPWMKTMDALSSVEYGRQGVTDIPVPIVSSAQAYIDEKIPHWVYYCCSPTGAWLNRFMDTPLPKVRMSGMLFYRLRAGGFLHWGFNYWHKMEQQELIDPFLDSTCGGAVPSGDPFMIYPGKDGKPIDSIRWEIFAEALQDYAILQTAGVKPDDALLAEIKSYRDFPRDEQWIRRTIETVLRR